MDSSDDIYQLAGVSKTYRKSGREILAVRELDLDIRAGEWLAVPGKTGHGQTTLLQLLGGLVRLYLPDLHPGPDAHRARERRSRADPAGRASPPAARTGNGRPGQRGARRPGSAPARRAVRRPAAAGGHRPGP